MKCYFAVWLFVLVIVAGCKNSNRIDIYFVPVGDAPVAQINELASHYQQKMSLTSVVLSPMMTSVSDFDLNRKQLVAENVLQSLQLRYSSYLQDNSAILIGITDRDMYPRSEDWQFCFGWRRPDIRMAVVSTARMNLHYPGEPTGQTDSSTRLRKVVTKDIGLMYLHKSPSNSPRSVLYNNILGIEELDQVTEDF